MRDLPFIAGLLSLALAVPAAAQSTPAASNASIMADVEAIASSRAMLAATILLSQPPFDEPSQRASSGLGSGSISTFKVGGSTFAVVGGAAGVPRRAIGADGSGVAILAKLPSTAAGVADGDVGRQAAYVLATLQGSRVQVWAFYAGQPSDAALSRRMIAALARLGSPLATFNRTFQPGAGVGAERHMLK